MQILIVNGPNLNLLGTRQPEVYGRETLSDLEDMISRWAEDMGVTVSFSQANDEGDIIDTIQQFKGDGIVINPGAFTHTSRAIAEAIGSVTAPVVEVHISNIREREPWRATSVISDSCVLTLYGRGLTGYRNAMRHLVNRAASPFETIRFGPHHDQIGDLRHGTGTDLVVLAHGGLWRHNFQRDTTESLATDLTNRGFTTWNLEYRRLGDGGGWPGSAHDALTALDFIPQLGIEPGRVLIVSHSAGSQLMMWAAARSSTAIDLHVALGPLLDIGATIDHEDTGVAEARMLAQHGAPLQVESDGVPTVIVHGDADQIVPVERSVRKAEDQGLEHHRTGCDHFSLLDPTKPEWAWVVERMGSTQ